MTIAELEAELSALGVTRISVRHSGAWTITLSRAHVIAASITGESLELALLAGLTFLRGDKARRDFAQTGGVT